MSRSRAIDTAPLYTASIFAGSFLLFLLEPMVARMALPRVGGAPAVWNSAMLVYQVLLLAGYGYAHAIGRWSGRRQAYIHMTVILAAACWLPIGLRFGGMPVDAEPELWVPLLLLGSIGPLFFAIAAQAPLLQRWFAIGAPARNPYSLYVASNLGSFGALLVYPLIVEPSLGLHEQSFAWTLLYILVGGLLLACAVAMRNHRDSPVRLSRASAPASAKRALWIALAAVPSGLMLSTTTHLTTNIMALPMIWVVPLGLYLLSFSLGFSESPWSSRIARLFPITLIVTAGFAFGSGTASPFTRAGVELVALFVTAAALHRRLYLLRPEVSQLTGFYLLSSLGGALGGLFCAVLAPLLFDWTYEHPLLLAAAALLVRDQPLLPRFAGLVSGARSRWIAAAALVLPLLALPHIPGHFAAMPAVAFILSLLAILTAGLPRLFTLCIVGLMLAKGGWATLETSWKGDQRARSYFGVSEVSDKDGIRLLAHGTTIHGMQRIAPAERRWPLSYYAPESGVGRIMRQAPMLFGAHARIGVVGLGAGTLACYARPGQTWRLFEIDPAVIGMATDPTKFTFLSQCAPQAPIIRGDGRLNLTNWKEAPFDLLVMDAFSSDAPPLHLLTSEAFDTYRQALARDGVIMVNISNRFMDFAPVLASMARAKGWSARLLDYQPDARGAGIGYTRSVWVALAPGAPHPDAFAAKDGWRTLDDVEHLETWSDDKASIIPVMRLFRPAASIGD